MSFADLHFPLGLPIDHDDTEAAIELARQAEGAQC